MARYLTGGEKVFVFHTIDLDTHALAQTVCADKSSDSTSQHLLWACRELGRPDFLQLDNDAAFTGLGRQARGFGRFLRIALYLGIELIFIPPAEPQRNHIVERVNGLWVSSFWEKEHFASRREVVRKSGKFLAWARNLCAARTGRVDYQASQGEGESSQAVATTNQRTATGDALDCRSYPFHSPSQWRWRDQHSQRAMEGLENFVRAVCLGSARYRAERTMHLASSFSARRAEADPTLCL